MKFTALRLSATASTLALSAAFASPAFAETAATTATQPASATDCSLPANAALPACKSEVGIKSGTVPTSSESIVVTGSRIRRPNLESPVPITSLSQEELTMTGDVNIGDRLNDLPALRSTFSQANSTRFIGTSGLNILDLRGLGTSRTLVLVNGRRHITASPGDYLIDVNTIPTDLIERVDIVTGGEAAVYGSDAVAGVVNFILKKNYDGIKLRAQSGISSRGDRPVNFVSLTAGKNFFDNRANVAANFEFADAGALYFRDRPKLTGAFSGRCQFNASSFAAGEPATGNGVPDQSFFCGVVNAAISTGGEVSPSGVSAATCQNPAILGNPALAARCLSPGTPQGEPRLFYFQPNGTLCEDVPALDFRPFASGNYIHNPNSTCLGGTTLRETGQLAPSLRRYMGNILAHYDINDALQPFIEAKYVHIYSHQEFQPSFFSGGLLGTFHCNNPFLTAQALAQLQAIGRCANPSTGLFTMSRFNVDLGGRVENDTRKTYRIVGGIQGDFNTDWHYEVSANWGHFVQNGRQLNDLQLLDLNGNFAGYLLAYDAVRDPNTGQIVCRVNSTSLAQDPFGAANDAPGCVPLNPFGNGQISQAARDYVNVTSRLDQKASEYDGLAYLSGDSSQIFSLPGGPLKFVIGGEWRKETASFKADPLSASGGTFFNAFADFNPPAQISKELFGELEQTIVRDIPGINELTITGAGRYSWYNKGAGLTKHTFAWNANAIYSPVRDLRIRGNYSKSVRVPTLSDLFTAPTQNFAQLLDPCDFPSGRIGPVGSTRYNNCLALGVPVGFTSTFANAQTSEIISSGNPFLTAETGKSWTLGGVITPRWVPGLSFSADYYHITVSNLISVLGGQTILNQCVDLPSINNQFCQLIFPRQTVDNPNTPENDIGALQNPALISAGVNFAKFKAYGIDMELAYRHTFSNGHRLNIHSVVTRATNRTNYTSPTQPNFPDRILSELGDPKWAGNVNVTYGIGRFDFNYSGNYIGKQTIGAYENYFHVPGNPNSPTNADFTREVFFPDVFYHAVRADYKLPYRGSKTFDFYLGADNVFDTKPPFGQLGTGGGDPFDAVGRYFYGGVTVDL